MRRSPFRDRAKYANSDSFQRNQEAFVKPSIEEQLENLQGLARKYKDNWTVVQEGSTMPVNPYMNCGGIQAAGAPLYGPPVLDEETAKAKAEKWNATHPESKIIAVSMAEQILATPTH